MPHECRPEHHDGQSPGVEGFEWERQRTVHHNQGRDIFLIQSIALQLYTLPPPHHTMYVHSHNWLLTTAHNTLTAHLYLLLLCLPVLAFW